jgi:hypothetical protein
MGVEQVSLELFDLFGSERDLRKFANSGVDAVHDFVGQDLALEQAAALVDARACVGVQLDRLAMAGDRSDILNLQRMPVQYQIRSCLVRARFILNNRHRLPPRFVAIHRTVRRCPWGAAWWTNLQSSAASARML